MKEKRNRKPKVKDYQIKAYWGMIPNESRFPELCMTWGNGIPKPDINLLFSIFRNERHDVLKELKKRGYDMSTLKFSIEKIKEEEVEG